MNPLNAVQELLKTTGLEHASDCDVGRVAAEAANVLEKSAVLINTALGQSYRHLLALLNESQPNNCSKLSESEASKSWGGSLKKRRSLLDAFGRETLRFLDQHFIPSSIEWLRTELAVEPHGNDSLVELRPRLQAIENVLGTLLSALITRGWSIESLFMLYRLILLPACASTMRSSSPYAFGSALDAVCMQLNACPKPYRVTFTISNVTKPNQFPEVVGDIEFKANAPELAPKTSDYVKRYASRGRGTLFATTTVEAQDGRMAGSIAGDRIAQVLDVVRFDYERKHIQLADRFLIEERNRHILLQVPGTVPNPDTSLSAVQLDGFMRRLQDLFSSGTLTPDAKDRIYAAFRLYRLGADTANFENKLVNWWTAVEFLVKGSGAAGGGIGAGVEHSLAPTIALSYLPKHLTALREILLAVGIELLDANGTRLEIKHARLLECYGLLKQEKYAEQIRAATSSRPFIWSKTVRFLEIAAEQTRLAETLRNHELRLRWHIQRIYRARCDIVHSAQRIVSATLLCANLEFYLKTVLSSFLEALHRHPTLRSPREFFDRQEHAYQQIVLDLAKGDDTSLRAILANKDSVSASTA
ncbi:hypothetical protein [Bordetella sp. LUAb4]|uniref:hypothetical protein n=1 Tax=Bordetella sp. LUAb4 TaxID=2843195 RepID=UPI001E331823|nr:hypothetical protein [Bordetella sp. LUAb4]